MSYEWMDIWKWDIAMKALNDLISWKIKNKEERGELLKNLLLYCGQDSLAMYKIFEVLKKST
jgi:hypothetical protein